ncbi:hypothetical protein MUK42_06914 [Musa troglodytarum]|uniref:Uncharacterized protein n=1 Tax=Musa troglodytarum TaxID=320322 RepID=A0A9E7H4Z6_9LILI|nr:hypothetical protein MUK42_06914 [Musa troglodytarum]
MQLGLAQQRGSEEPLVPSPTQTECAVTGRRLLRPATARLERVFLHCRSPVPRRKEDGNEEVEEDGSGSDVLCHDLGRLPFLAVNGQGRRLDRSPPRRKVLCPDSSRSPRRWVNKRLEREMEITRLREELLAQAKQKDSLM